MISPELPLDRLLGALHAAEHAQIAVLPLLAMCDRWDIGGLSTNLHPQTGGATIFIYDGHPGGIGITRRGFLAFDALVDDAHRLVSECPCEQGCPSCVQSPKCGNLNEPLSKLGRRPDDGADARRRLVRPRPPAVAARAMVATSQPLATRAGLRALERGGNAADAALAAAAVLCVTEPMMTGLGGDLFALVWRDGEAEGLDAAGPAAAGAQAGAPPAADGPDSVTVPGAVAGWAALAERHGRLGLDACLADAIDVAAAWLRGGRALRRALARRRPPSARPAARARRGRAPAGSGRHARGHRRRRARTRSTAARAAERIAAVLGARAGATSRGSRHAGSRRCGSGYRGVEVLELPPPTQGIAALEALALLEDSGGRPRDAGARRYGWRSTMRTPTCATARTSPTCSTRRTSPVAARHRPHDRAESPGGTVYLCAVDEDRMAVSLVQSLFEAFGSGVLVEGTGVVLHNRGAGFAIGGLGVEPGRRPVPHADPGDARADGALLGPFGVMGGTLQAAGARAARRRAARRRARPAGGAGPPALPLRRRRRAARGGTLGARRRAGRSRAATRPRARARTASAPARRSSCEGESLLGGSDSRRDGYAAGF